MGGLKRVDLGPVTIKLDGDPEVEPMEYEAEKPWIIRVIEFIHSKYEIRYNEMTQNLEYKPIGASQFEQLTEMILNDFWIDLTLSDVKTNRGAAPADSTILKLVKSNRFTKRYHPLKEYLTGLKWDGTDHIAALASTIQLSDETDLYYEGKPQSYYWPTFLKRWMLNSAAIAMGYQAAAQSHSILILEGKQFKGKTTWLDNLCPPSLQQQFRYTGHITTSLKDGNTPNLLAEKWFVNIDDQLHTVMAKDFNEIKSMVTAPDITNRKAYARDLQKRQRTASFMASVNGREIFTDNENRRYLCFALDPHVKWPVDLDLLRQIDMDQVWAQVMNLLKGGERFQYTHEEIAAINTMNQMFAQLRVEDEWLMKLFSPSDRSDAEAAQMQVVDMLKIASEISGIKLSRFWWAKALEKQRFTQVTTRAKDYNNQVRKIYYVRPKYTQSPTDPTGRTYYFKSDNDND